MTRNKSGRIGVVGGGLGGLAAACTLAARGYAVTLFEKSSRLGGKAAVLERAGYRFDMGPTILTLPSVLRRIFTEAGRSLDEVLPLVPCDPQWRCFYEGGGVLDLVADPDAMRRNLDAFAPGSAPGYQAFLDFSRDLHDISQRFFFWRSIGSIRDMIDFRSFFDLTLLRDVLRLRLGRSVAECVRGHVAEPRVAQMIDHFTQYVGSAPDESPAVLCSIAHMQTQEGIWYPRGGTASVPAALARLAEELGVEIRLETGVCRILLDSARAVAGVETDQGETISLAAVVSNADAVRTHRELLGGQVAKRFDRRREYEPACSGVVLYLGLDRAYEHLAHHNFVFSRDPHEEFDAIYRQGIPAPDPTCYVCAPARTESTVAPPGGEALYVLVHTPWLRPSHDWSRMYPPYREVILRKLAQAGGLTDLPSRIVCEEKLTPQDIHDRYRVLNGAIYGLASHGKLFGAFKPANRSPDVPGLYLAGGAAHPGPGMPMVLMSGWIAADTLDSDQRSRRASRKGAKPPRREDNKEGNGEGSQSARDSSSSFFSSFAPLRLCVRSSSAAAQHLLPRRSGWLVRLFTRYARYYLRRNFHAVRLARAGRPVEPGGEPLIVVLNHPSWWDPLLGVVLAELFPHYRHYVPMDATGLARYRFLERLGFFGVEVGRRSGALRFLRTAGAILETPWSALWITAQGRFTDPRERPVRLREGVGHLVRRLERGVILPLALEYPFWQERFPEALARFGAPLSIEARSGQTPSVADWMTQIERALEDAQDDLARLSLSRDPPGFDTLIDGSTGVGGLYDLWRRVVALWKGERFQSAHGSERLEQRPSSPVGHPL
jgi:phytoene desaturase